MSRTSCIEFNTPMRKRASPCWLQLCTVGSCHPRPLRDAHSSRRILRVRQTIPVWYVFRFVREIITLVCVHFIVCSMYVSSCSTPSFSSPSFSSSAKQIPPLRFRPSFSSPAISTPAKSSFIFQSCKFQSCKFRYPTKWTKWIYLLRQCWRIIFIFIYLFIV